MQFSMRKYTKFFYKKIIQNDNLIDQLFDDSHFLKSLKSLPLKTFFKWTRPIISSHSETSDIVQSQTSTSFRRVST